MEITFSAVDENRTVLFIKTDENETITVGQIIPIELTDETVIEREIKAIRQWKESSNKNVEK